MVVWSDPTVARAASLSINNFINSKVQEIKSRCTSPSHVLSFDNFRRLLEIYKSIKSLGNAEAADSVTAFLADKFQQKVESHPSESTSDAARMSALELFEDLEFWVALKSLLEGSFSPGNVITDSITKVISLDLAACPTDVVAMSGSLRVMELGAKLMRALPQQHQSKILRVVDSHMAALYIADVQGGAMHVHNSGEPAIVDVGDGGVAQVGTQASMELTAAKNTHAKVRCDIPLPYCHRRG